MYQYCNMPPPPWWGYPYPPTQPPMMPDPGKTPSLKSFIREWKMWEKFQKQQEEEKKKKDKGKPPNGNKLQAWEVFVLMTALSPIVGPIITALKDHLMNALQ